jgi:hypothetical protein
MAYERYQLADSVTTKIDVAALPERAFAAITDAR